MCQPQSPSGASTPSRHHVPPSSSSPHSGPGIVRQMTDSVEPTSMAAAIVVTFVVVQFRIVLKEWAVKLGVRLLQKLFDWWRGAEEAEGRETGGRRGNGGRKVEPKNNSERRASKRFADKQVGSDLDAAVEEEQEHTFERAPLEVPYHATVYPESEMVKRSQFFYESLKVRRSVRCFSPRPVPPKVVQNLIKTAGTAPSGANLQPWTFCVVQSDRIKRAVREVVEEQEQLNYSRRMGAQWVLDIAPLNVNWNKPYLTEAPFLIVVMKHAYQLDEHGERRPTYYSEQSTAIAVGILLAAIQNAGLVTVVTTPLNAGAAIREILQRPINEKVSLLLPLGYPAEGTFVPDIRKKPVEEIMRIY